MTPRPDSTGDLPDRLRDELSEIPDGGLSNELSSELSGDLSAELRSEILAELPPPSPRTAPARVWERIDDGIGHTGPRRWTRVAAPLAASVMLLAGLAGGLQLANRHSDNPQKPPTVEAPVEHLQSQDVRVMTEEEASRGLSDCARALDDQIAAQGPNSEGGLTGNEGPWHTEYAVVKAASDFTEYVRSTQVIVMSDDTAVVQCDNIVGPMEVTYSSPTGALPTSPSTNRYWPALSNQTQTGCYTTAKLASQAGTVALKVSPRVASAQVRTIVNGVVGPWISTIPTTGTALAMWKVKEAPIGAAVEVQTQLLDHSGQLLPVEVTDPTVNDGKATTVPQLVQQFQLSCQPKRPTIVATPGR